MAFPSLGYIIRGRQKMKGLALITIFAVLGASMTSAQNSAPTKVEGKGTTTASGLQYWDIVVGSGATAVSGRDVTVHYTGWLINGTKFDSSIDSGRPFTFPFGGDRVIKGW